MQFEVINGIKTRYPSGAYRIFLQEKAKENVIHSIIEGRKLWDKLNEDKKNEYLKKSHKSILAYKYKRMIYPKF